VSLNFKSCVWSKLSGSQLLLVKRSKTRCHVPCAPSKSLARTGTQSREARHAKTHLDLHIPAFLACRHARQWLERAATNGHRTHCF
jgi:hypothetical protein